jgi:hypothetical protein
MFAGRWYPQQRQAWPARKLVQYQTRRDPSATGLSPTRLGASMHHLFAVSMLVVVSKPQLASPPTRGLRIALDND